MTSYALNRKRKQTGLGVARIVFAGLVGLIAGADVADAGRTVAGTHGPGSGRSHRVPGEPEVTAAIN